ncbi:MAG: hypothetical protein FWF35_04480 [Elusimicrobia bacterium]|nr:hypothetical protein [Elusimicrobiota bacterium]
MIKKYFPFFKQTVALGIITILLFDSNTAALAQTVSNQQLVDKKTEDLNNSYNNVLVRDRVNKEITRYNAVVPSVFRVRSSGYNNYGAVGDEIAKRKFLEEIKYKKQLESDDIFKRAEEIKFIILGKDNKTPDQENKPYTLEEFTKERVNQLNAYQKNFFAKADDFYQKESIRLNNTATQLSYGEYPPQQIAAWKETNENKLKQSVEDAKAEFLRSKAAELAKTNLRYKEYLGQVDREKQQHIAEVYDTLESLTQELMGMYKKNPEKLLSYVAELSPLLLIISGNHKELKSLFTPEQKKDLLFLYTSILNVPSKDCEKLSKCDIEVNALSGIGILGESEQDAHLIGRFIEEHEHNGDYTRILITGVSALLSLKQYGVINSYIIGASGRENNSNDFDMFNFSQMAEAYNTRDGKYLGEVSKYAQYQENPNFFTMDNAWTDVARLLAEEGSQGSLDILKEHGVDKCEVFEDTQINGQKDFHLGCGDIILPFLTGALLSGKSGVGNYNPGTYMSAGPYITKAGTIYITEQAAAKNRANSAAAARILAALAKQKGVSPDALFALYIIDQNMGDLPYREEYNLDNGLYKKFGSQLDKNLNKFALVDNNPSAAQTKESRIQTAKIVNIVGQTADVAFIAWCFWDLSKLATKGVKGISRLWSRVFRGIELARAGSAVEKIAFLRTNLSVYQKTFAGRKDLSVLAKVNERIFKAMEPTVLEQGRYYFTDIAKSARPKGAEEKAVEAVLSNTVFDAQKGAFVTDNKAAYAALQGFEGHGKVLQETKITLDNAAKNAAGKFDKYSLPVKSKRPVVGKIINKAGSLYNDELGRQLLARETEKAFANSSYFNTFSKAIGRAYGNTLSAIEEVPFIMDMKSGKYGEELVKTPHAAGETRNLSLFAQGKEGAPERRVGNVEMSLDEPIPGVTSGFWHKGIFKFFQNSDFIEGRAAAKRQKISSVILEQKNAASGKKVLRFVGSDNTGIDANLFKITVDKESVPSLLRAAEEYADNRKLTGKAEKLLELKLTADYKPENYGIFSKVKDFFRNKEAAFKETIPAVITSEKGETAFTGVKLRVNKELEGFKLVVNGADNGVTLVKPGGGAFEGKFNVLLPKMEIKKFTKIADSAGFLDRDIHLGLTGSKNKINSLFVISGLSLSAASTSLIKPLNTNYPEASYKSKFAITVIMPYAMSLLSPAIAPFVKRYGLVKVLQGSLIVAAGALVIPSVTGFYGFGGITPEHKPSLFPLVAGALLVGASTAMTRATLTPLTDAIGGGGNTLKSVGFKNLSSFLMLLPPAAANGVAYAFGAKNEDMIYKTPDGTEQHFRKKPTDFSFAYPVLLGASLGTLAMLRGAKISSLIGRGEEYLKMPPGPLWKETANVIMRKRDPMPFLKEIGSSFATIKNKDVLPVIGASTLIVGSEAALVNSYSMSEVNRYVIGKYKKSGEGPWAEDGRGLYSVAIYTAAPFIFRMYSGKVLELMGGKENPLAYKRLLTASLGTAAVGTGILYTQHDMPSFLTGMALTSVGFASTTNGFFKLGQLNLKAAGAAKTFLTSYEVLYPGVHIGMAVVPALMTTASDINKNKYPDSKQYLGLQESLWVPALGVAAGTIIGSKVIGLDSKIFSSKLFQYPAAITAGTFGFIRKTRAGSFGVGGNALYKDLTKPEEDDNKSEAAEKSQDPENVFTNNSADAYKQIKSHSKRPKLTFNETPLEDSKLSNSQ